MHFAGNLCLQEEVHLALTINYSCKLLYPYTTFQIPALGIADEAFT